MADEPLIYREEVAALLFGVSDLLAEVREIKELLRGEDDGQEDE